MFLVMTGVLVIYTQRIELMAAPLAVILLLLILNYYNIGVVITTWVLIIFLSRIPATFFGFEYFSYAAYFCTLATSFAFLARLYLTQKEQFVSHDVWIIALFALPITIGASRGIQHLDEIPLHMLTAWEVISLDARAYLRTFYIAPMYMPLLAVLVAGAVSHGLDPDRLIRPVLALAWFFAILVPVSVVATGLDLGGVAEYAQSSRADFLAEDGGLHPNVYGLYCAMVYALLLGRYNTLDQVQRKQVAIPTMLASTFVILLTFSRSAVLAFCLVNGIYFLRINILKKIAILFFVLIILALLPEAFFERFRLGMDTGDLDWYSSGRLGSIWMPLLPDITENWFNGQGHYSIYWTNAQLIGTMYPVTHSHNAFIDLVLDYGIWGTAMIIFFYLFIWHKFRVLANTYPSSRLRGYFYGGHLAMVVLLSTTLNGRLTPELVHFPLWVVIGIMLGSLTVLKGQATSQAGLNDLQPQGVA